MTKKFIALSIVAFLFIAISLFTPVEKAAALDVPLNQGFFTQKAWQAGSQWEDVIQSCGGYVFPTGISKEGFIDKVMSYYNGGCSGGHNPMGAKFIISMMLGVRRSNLSSNDIESWKALIRSDRLSVVSTKASFSINSGYYSNIGDVSFISDSQAGKDVLVIRYKNSSGSLENLMTIKSDCGNIVTNNVPSVWDVKPYIQPVSGNYRQSVAKGEVARISWQAYGQVEYGITSSDVSVRAEYSGAWAGSQTLPSIKVGSGKGQRSTVGNVFRNVTTADVGKTFCVRAVVSPGGRAVSSNDPPEYTGYSCVTVVEGAIPPNPCRPINARIEPMTYGPFDNGFVRIDSYTPRYKAKTDVYTDNNWYSKPEMWGTQDWNRVDVTKRNTDGNVHAITLTNETNNVTGLDTKLHTYYRSINYKTRYWIPTTYKNVTTCVNTGTVKKPRWRCTTYPVVDQEGRWSSWQDRGVYSYINRFDNYGIPGLPGNSDTAEFWYVKDGPTYWYTDVYYTNDVRYRVNPYTSYSPGQYPGKITYNKFTNYSGTSRNASGSPIGPCFDYKLTASLNNFGSRREAQESYGVSGTINSSPYTPTDPKWSGFAGGYGTHTKSKPTKWVITLMKVPVNVVMPDVPEGVSSQEPCNYFDGGALSDCRVASQGTAVFGGGPGGPNGGGGGVSGGFSVPDEYAGTELCYALSIFPNQSDPLFTSASYGGSDQWFHASFSRQANCVMVVKKPKFQVLGGDLAVGKTTDSSTTSKGGNILASNSVLSGRTFGSWAEYGILATGGITGMASGSMFAGGSSGSSACLISKLTFANTASSTNCDGTLGRYSFKTPMRDVASFFPIDNLTPKLSSNINVSALASGYYTSTNSSLTVSGGYIGKSVVLNMPNTDITITGNINANTAPLTAIGQLGQLVIIAKNIYIQGNVSQIDAWLIAQKGTVNTCIDVSESAPLSVNICNQQLRVNGPVSTNRLILKRTYGSDPGGEKGVPAEVFNLRADTYLWIYANSLKDNRYRSTYLIEQPPRL